MCACLFACLSAGLLNMAGAGAGLLKNGCDHLGAFCGHQEFLAISTCLFDSWFFGILVCLPAFLLACPFACLLTCVCSFWPVLACCFTVPVVESVSGFASVAQVPAWCPSLGAYWCPNICLGSTLV